MRISTAQVLILLILSLSWPISVIAQETNSKEHYTEGLKAYKSGRYRDALKLFDRAKFQFDEKDVNYATVHYNLGRCVQKIVDTEPDGPLSCKGVQWFKAYLKLTRGAGPNKSRELAKRGLVALRVQCPAQPATWNKKPNDARHLVKNEPYPETRVTSILPAVLTGLATTFVVGGVGLQFQYLSTLEDRDDAFNKFKAEEDLATREAHEIDVRELEIEAASIGAVSWSLIGAGAAIGSVALYAWLSDEDKAYATKPSLTRRPGALTWTW